MPETAVFVPVFLAILPFWERWRHARNAMKTAFFMCKKYDKKQGRFTSALSEKIWKHNGYRLKEALILGKLSTIVEIG